MERRKKVIAPQSNSKTSGMSAQPRPEPTCPNGPDRRGCAPPKMCPKLVPNHSLALALSLSHSPLCLSSGGRQIPFNIASFNMVGAARLGCDPGVSSTCVLGLANHLLLWQWLLGPAHRVVGSAVPKMFFHRIPRTDRTRDDGFGQGLGDFSMSVPSMGYTGNA